ncbi:MAG: cyclic nucleotide-binding domain-containing protein [Deltaproteobacteria bacterium]|nr:cyclic nucleotide-binding domain-containing protein [Deltaproteobacteria bacterium]MBW2338834.1 cyclic nucleotide-binding domain-containing protein [Deltaproteobacteria bacterium]
MKSKTYKPGEIIIQEGEMGRDLYVLNDGVVEISTKEDNGSVILNEIEPPQILGELSFLTGLPRTATAKAKTNTELYIFRYENLEGQIAELPKSIKPIINTLINRVRAQDRRIVELEEEMLTLKRKLLTS